MSRLLAGLIAVLLASCNPFTWMSGIDPAEFTWDAMPSASPKDTADKALQACLASAPQTGTSPAGTPVITRSDAAPTVETCMAGKGYRKLYLSRWGSRNSWY